MTTTTTTTTMHSDGRKDIIIDPAMFKISNSSTKKVREKQRRRSRSKDNDRRRKINRPLSNGTSWGWSGGIRKDEWKHRQNLLWLSLRIRTNLRKVISNNLFLSCHKWTKRFPLLHPKTGHWDKRRTRYIRHCTKHHNYPITIWTTFPYPCAIWKDLCMDVWKEVYCRHIVSGKTRRNVRTQFPRI